MRSLRARAGALDPLRVDAIFAVAVIIELEAEAWLNRGIPESYRVITAVASVLFAASIGFRRRSPSFALLFCLSIVVIQAPLGGTLLQNAGGDIVPVLVLSYSAGAWLETRPAIITLMLAFPLAVAGGLLSAGGTASVGEGSSLLAFDSLLIFPSWFVGRLVRERSRRTASFHELAEQAAVEQEAHELAAIEQERARIGSELQDIIAHSVSVMVVQAGGARLALHSDPNRARESILNVEHTGREALADLRRLLGMLRKDDDPRALAPQPGLNQLAALIDSVGVTGFSCEAHTEGEPVDLTPGVDLVAYRVIEASLLSAARDRGNTAVVTVRYRPDALELEIGGNGSAADLDGELRAIAQRVALYDGTLQMSPAGGGRFRVLAQLPLGAAIPA